MQRENLRLLTSLNPHQDGALRDPQLPVFSLNVIYQPRPSKSRGKTNCRNIEIPLTTALPGPTSQFDHSSGQSFYSKQDQEMASIEANNLLLSRDHFAVEQSFPFLSLPFELRLKIYALVLPSRTHSIVTQYPHNGYYYSGTSMVSHSAQTLYPAQPYSRPPSPDQKQKLTTYKLLNANFHHDFPSPSTCPEILRTCKQIRNEAEPVMYGAETVFDFGVYVDAVVPFLNDRSALARRAIRHIGIAREIPVLLSAAETANEALQDTNQDGEEVVDGLWNTTSAFLRDQCAGLRTVNLTLWAENGGLVEEILPTVTDTRLEAQDTEGQSADRNVEDEKDKEIAVHVAEDGKLWRQWEWTRALLKVEVLRHVKVTWWGFTASKMRESKFDGWLGRRMVADKSVRDRMIYEGRIIEGVTVIPGDCYTRLTET